MGISAKEAAELVGLTKNAIFKAIKSGKISATKDTNGEWRIEPVELFRVYPPANDSARTILPPSSQQTIASLQRENELLRERIQDKDKLIQAHEDALKDMRHTILLIESRSAAPPVQPEASKGKSFWHRLFGR